MPQIKAITAPFVVIQDLLCLLCSIYLEWAGGALECSDVGDNDGGAPGGARRFRDGFVSLHLKDMRNVNLQWGTTCSDHSLLDCMNVLGGRQWGHAIAGVAALVRAKRWFFTPRP